MHFFGTAIFFSRKKGTKGWREPHEQREGGGQRKRGREGQLRLGYGGISFLSSVIQAAWTSSRPSKVLSLSVEVFFSLFSLVFLVVEGFRRSLREGAQIGLPLQGAKGFVMGRLQKWPQSLLPKRILRRSSRVSGNQRRFQRWVGGTKM